MPENITLLPKSAGKTNGRNAWNERIVAVKKGESVAIDPARSGRLAGRHPALAAVLGARGRDGGLREGQKLRILFAPDGGRLRVVRVIVVGDSAIEAVVALSDTGKYVAVDVQSLSTAAPRSPKPTKTTRTTPPRCGSTRASTKPRCATRCRAR